MNKNALIDATRPIPGCAAALDLARDSLSDAAADAEQSLIYRRQSDIQWRTGTILLILLVSVLPLVGHQTIPFSAKLVWLGLSFPFALVIWVAICELCYVVHADVRYGDMLAPLSGGECAVALSWVGNGNTWAAAWRKQALSERNVLRCYDYEMMRRLDLAESMQANQPSLGNANSVERLHRLAA